MRKDKTEAVVYSRSLCSFKIFYFARQKVHLPRIAPFFLRVRTYPFRGKKGEISGEKGWSSPFGAKKAL
jgi:hypothetical protein